MSDVLYDKFITAYPTFIKIGQQRFRTKFWLLLLLSLKPLTQNELAGMRCKSLRYEISEINVLHSVLSELENNGLLQSRSNAGNVIWRPSEKSAFTIRAILDDVEDKQPESFDLIKKLLNECSSGLSNEREIRQIMKDNFSIKDLFPHILKTSAKAMINLIFISLFDSPFE